MRKSKAPVNQVNTASESMTKEIWFGAREIAFSVLIAIVAAVVVIFLNMGMASAFQIFIATFVIVYTLTLIHPEETQAQSVELRESRERLRDKLAKDPDKLEPAWEDARNTLEHYFRRNLNQIKVIFNVAILVMLIGFGFVLWGVRISIDTGLRIGVVSSASGIITQFIGLTFMLIYRATLSQATQFMAVLERINTVGMAVQILDGMKSEDHKLKDSTRADMIRLLLGSSPGRMVSKLGAIKKSQREEQDSQDFADRLQ